MISPTVSSYAAFRLAARMGAFRRASARRSELTEDENSSFNATRAFSIPGVACV